LHTLLTGERDGYYAAYEPTASALARCINGGWTYTGQPYAPWKGRPRGAPFAGERSQLVVCIQNHDQVGNRAFGTRLSHDAGVGAFESAAVLLLFLPYVPLLFMGQEWAASTPFLFFSDHEGELGQAVSKGRRKEFEGFAAFEGEIPDPQAPETFLRSKLDWNERTKPAHAHVRATHRTMLRLRREDPILAGTADVEARASGELLYVSRGDGRRVLVLNAGTRDARIDVASGARVLVATGRYEAGTLGPKAAVLLAT
jgi:maltooligosyltrehalose trehalohydrolase